MTRLPRPGRPGSRLTSMAMTSLSPPLCTALTTYAALKAEMKLTTDTDQLYLESLILDASAIIETHLPPAHWRGNTCRNRILAMAIS